ncbi:type III pantothenate kinase [Butyrivibrio sp. X503]|uniref:type III pantothenate kinase n=1 Tax=Butyrivibrio sp. X503 TaxID=2364878 RepID=UPI000EA92693|nr:type III pantothenate kinase [Butyrivibrio sp. X503]RKM58307.1 type III pantothenate kinase [Butyrivibrio sp. X503]
MEKILTVDIGNTNIATCLWNGDKATMLKSFATDKNATSADLTEAFSSVLMSETGNKKTELITGSVISCVVPSIESAAKEALHTVTGCNPIIVNCNLDLEINLDIYDKKSLGADRIADIVGAAKLYNTPVIVCDLGTCTTISAVDSNKNLIGGMITLGIQSSLDALHERVPHLPLIQAKESDSLIGYDTPSSILTGAVVGTASMISETVNKLCESPDMSGATLVLTGGNAGFVLPWFKDRSKTVYEPDLIMKGLREIYTNFC